MSKRILILMCSIFLVVPLVFMGCGGSDGSTGATGATGPPGPPGPPGPGLSTAFNLESCAICHDDQTVRNGDAHQADYDQRFQDQVVTVSGLAYAYNATDNSHNVTFTMSRNGVSFPCTDIKTGAPADSLSIAFAEYDSCNQNVQRALAVEPADRQRAVFRITNNAGQYSRHKSVHEQNVRQ